LLQAAASSVHSQRLRRSAAVRRRDPVGADLACLVSVMSMAKPPNAEMLAAGLAVSERPCCFSA